MGGKRSCCILDAARAPFAFATITILSLLVPLSFLLLSRISSESYLQSLTAPEHHGFVENSSVQKTLSFFRYTNPYLVQALVSIISLAALVNCVTGKRIIREEPTSPRFAPRLYAAWIFLCTLQVCVGLGVECSMEAGNSGYKIELGNEMGMLSRLIFFLGLHETVSHWSRGVVKPVVDDTVFGGLMEERVVQKVALAAGCGLLWWWRLRDEIDSLVLVAEIKLQLGMDVGVSDFLSWWLYYVVVTIGLVRLVRSFIWVSIALCCRRSMRVDSSGASGHSEASEKV